MKTIWVGSKEKHRGKSDSKDPGSPRIPGPAWGWLQLQLASRDLRVAARAALFLQGKTPGEQPGSPFGLFLSGFYILHIPTQWEVDQHGMQEKEPRAPVRVVSGTETWGPDTIHSSRTRVHGDPADSTGRTM